MVEPATANPLSITVRLFRTLTAAPTSDWYVVGVTVIDAAATVTIRKSNTVFTPRVHGKSFLILETVLPFIVEDSR
jgi:hypothetical protein